MTIVPAPLGDDAESHSESAADPFYAYKPSVMGAPHEFRLAPDALEWRKGFAAGRARYETIRRIRLSFRPSTVQRHRSLAEVWPHEGGRLDIASVSWRSMMEQERQDAAYTAFITALHQRIAAAGGTPRLQSGSSPYLYWPGVMVLVAMAVMALASVVQLLGAMMWGGAAFLGAFLAVLLWQMGGFFQRNWPSTYRADAIPPQVLPKP